MISVCLATFNGEKYIKEQLDSILLQLDVSDEIVVSDDGSSDRTLDIIESYGDTRIKIFKNHFKSPMRNFEFLISKASNNYIFLSDQDDIWHKDKVKLYKEVFDDNQNVSLVVSDLQIINSKGERINRLFYKNGFSSSLLKNIISNNFIGCSMAFKSTVKNHILPFPENLAMHDWWIGMCCILFDELYFLDKKLTFYRRHENNVTKEGGGTLLLKAKWRINILKNLILRYLKLLKI